MTTPEIILINVDFPAPFGPSKPKKLPAGIYKDTSSKAKFWVSSLQALFSFFISIASLFLGKSQYLVFIFLPINDSSNHNSL